MPWRHLLDGAKDIKFAVEVEAGRGAALKRATTNMAALLLRARAERRAAGATLSATIGSLGASLGASLSGTQPGNVTGDARSPCCTPGTTCRACC